jgi:hypothetical protein
VLWVDLGSPRANRPSGNGHKPDRRRRPPSCESAAARARRRGPQPCLSPQARAIFRANLARRRQRRGPGRFGAKTTIDTSLRSTLIGNCRRNCRTIRDCRENISDLADSLADNAVCGDHSPSLTSAREGDLLAALSRRRRQSMTSCVEHSSAATVAHF